MLFAVCCLVCVVHCVLVLSCGGCWLLVVCCLLSVGGVGCSVCVVRWLFVVVCNCAIFAACCLLSDVCCWLLCDADVCRCVLFVVCSRVFAGGCGVLRCVRSSLLLAVVRCLL